MRKNFFNAIIRELLSPKDEKKLLEPPRLPTEKEYKYILHLYDTIYLKGGK